MSTTMDSSLPTGPTIPPRKHFRSTSSSSATWRNRSRQSSTSSPSASVPVLPTALATTGRQAEASVPLKHQPQPGPLQTSPTAPTTAPTAHRDANTDHANRSDKESTPIQPPPKLQHSPNRPPPILAASATARTSISSQGSPPKPVAATSRIRLQSPASPQTDALPASPAAQDRRTRPAHATSGSVGSIKDSIATVIRSWSRSDHDKRDATGTNTNAAAAASTTQPNTHRHSRISSFSRRLSISGPPLSPSFASNAALAQPNLQPSPLDISPKKIKSQHRNSRSLTSLPFLRGPSSPPLQPEFHAPAILVNPVRSPPSIEPSAAPAVAAKNLDTSPSPHRRRHSKRVSESHSLRKLAQANDSVENLHKRKSSIVAISVPFEAPPATQEPLPVTYIEQPTRTRSRGRREEAPVGRPARQMEGDEEPAGRRRRQEKEKKAMLSRALQQAHAAVILDNEQSFEGAIDAYVDACHLLQQVLIRSSAEEDKAKLDAIRSTYENRILELRQLNPELGASRHLLSSELGTSTSLGVRPAVNTRQGADQSDQYTNPSAPTQPHPTSVSTYQPSHPQQPHSQPPYHDDHSVTPTQHLSSDPRQSSSDPRIISDLAPPPLGARAPQSSVAHTPQQSVGENEYAKMALPADGHSREDSGGAMSWLDTIEESGPSSVASSVHSVSENGIHRRALRTVSGGTEADFNAAMDAAVEAAYGEGLEPYEDARRASLQIKSAMANVHLAKERVREAEREDAILAAHRRNQHMTIDAAYDLPRSSLDDEGEEEERMLEEMTKEFMGEEYNLGLNEKSTTIPRQSDSSEFSGSSAWHSSVSSSRTTAGTTMSTATDDMTGKSSHGLPRLDEETRIPQDLSHETQRSPPKANGRENSSTRTTAEDIRSRRLSGQPGQPKQLKIETAVPSTVLTNPPTQAGRSQQPIKTDANSLAPKSAHSDQQSLPSANPRSADSLHPASYFNLHPTSPHPGVSPVGSAMTTSPATPGNNLDRSLTQTSATTNHSTSHRVLSRKNKSNVSLNGSRSRNFSASSPDESEPSTTPLSQHFYGTGGNGSSYGLPQIPGTDQIPALPAFPPDLVAMMHADSVTAAKFLDNDIHSGDSASDSNNPAANNAPIPLEPCPESYLLRPFWLMRAVFQTLAHPRGGYISTKLFVPRDVWRVKGVKLRSIDDKIAACDLLAAALVRLGSVDTLDADAVLEEMQALEATLEQAQTTLTKKLGAEVGVNGIQALFKDAPRGPAGSDSANPTPHSSLPDFHQSLPAQSTSHRTASSGKSYLSSWRKLRSKSSAVGLSNANSHSSTTGAGSLTDPAGSQYHLTAAYKKDSLTMSTLPMTSLTVVRFAKRDLEGLSRDNEGPHAAYVESLARLCDAVQIVDQIARQVEDPGLKFSSSTHVGLELCTRHAAEFFGFYICRFVLSDLGILLDKFIKRGSEWVLV